MGKSPRRARKGGGWKSDDGGVKHPDTTMSAPDTHAKESPHPPPTKNKRRGRPPKKQQTKNENKGSDVDGVESPPKKARRGRQSKGAKLPTEEVVSEDSKKSAGSEKRPSRRKSKETKPDTQRSSDDALELSSARKKNRGGRSKSKVAKHQNDDDGVEEMDPVGIKEEENDGGREGQAEAFTCPRCNKVFTSFGGRKYHVDNNVCQPKKKAKSKQTRVGPSEGGVGSGLRRGKRSTRAKVVSYADDSEGDNEIHSDDEFVPKKETAGDDDGDEYDMPKSKGSPKRKGVKRKRKSSGPTNTHTPSSGGPTRNFLKLEPGAKFITKFGIVEVVADNQLPPDSHITKIDADAGVNFARTINRWQERELRVVDQIAAGTRHRREELKKLYLASLSSGSCYSDAQSKAWKLYCRSITPKQLLHDGLTRLSTADDDMKRKEMIINFDHSSDPRYPKDHYPERIVKCRLIADERKHLIAKPGGILDDDGDDFECHEVETSVHHPKIISAELFLQRKELYRMYRSTQPRYTCGGCGKSHDYRGGIVHHLRTGTCAEVNTSKREERRKRIEEIEHRAFSGSGHDLLSDLHGVSKRPPSKSSPAAEAEFGNPHKIKQYKKHKMPPWLVFNDQRSSMYPEIYASLDFKRGAQNRNFYNKAKDDDTYMTKAERRRISRKWKTVQKKMPDVDYHYFVNNPQAEQFQFRKPTPKKVTARKPTFKPPMESQSLHPPPNQAERAMAKPVEFNAEEFLASDMPSLPSSLPPVPCNIDTMDMDFGNFGQEDVPMVDAQSAFIPGNEAKAATKLPPVDDASDGVNKATEAIKKTRRRRKPSNRPIVTKKKKPIVVDTQVLATESEAGRYPTINRFYDKHEEQCVLCKKPGDEPLINCAFCKNSVHQSCLDKRMLGKDPPVFLRESERHDTPMCHDCISVVMFRRSRAENRRIEKWQQEVTKLGLGSIPMAAGLAYEVHMDGNDDEGREGSTAEDDEPTYQPCPDGGPGGLICCSYCTAAYSRFLSNTAKEMEAQSVAAVGQEVSELLDLLADAKQRLRRVAAVSESNEGRRDLLDQNMVSHG